MRNPNRIRKRIDKRADGMKRRFAKEVVAWDDAANKRAVPIKCEMPNCRNDGQWCSRLQAFVCRMHG